MKLNLRTITASLLACALPLQPLRAEPEFADTVEALASGTDRISYRTGGIWVSYRRQWMVDANGKGEMEIAPVSGYKIPDDTGTNRVFVFVPGKHSFDIGESGYEALARALHGIISAPKDFTTYRRHPCASILDAPAGWLQWSQGLKPGSIMIDHICLSDEGKAANEQIIECWREIARRMITSGQAGVTEGFVDEKG